MMLFWTVAALMLAAAVGLLLRPLLVGNPEPDIVDADALNIIVFRDRLAELKRAEPPLSPDEYRRARSELERELLADTAPPLPRRPEPPVARWAAPVVGILVPALAFGLYLHFGSPHLLAPPTGEQHMAADGPMTEDMRELAARLRTRLQQQPDDVEGWLLLARTLGVMEQHLEAAEALQQARQLTGDAPALLAEQAEILAMARDGEMAGEPAVLVEQALALDPAHPHALWLAGLEAAQRQHFAAAVDLWTRLLEVTPEDDDGIRMIQANIQRAQAAMVQTASPEGEATGGGG